MKLKTRTEVISQTKAWLASCSRSTVQGRKESMCDILFEEKGDVFMRKNKFWAMMYGDNALLVFKPEQKVEVGLFNFFNFIDYVIIYN